MHYKWESAVKWLHDKINHPEIGRNELREFVSTLVDETDSDDIQDIYQDEMVGDGCFVPIPDEPEEFYFHVFGDTGLVALVPKEWFDTNVVDIQDMDLETFSAGEVNAHDIMIPVPGLARRGAFLFESAIKDRAGNETAMTTAGCQRCEEFSAALGAWRPEIIEDLLIGVQEQDKPKKTVWVATAEDEKGHRTSRAASTSFLAAEGLCHALRCKQNTGNYLSPAEMLDSWQQVSPTGRSVVVLEAPMMEEEE